MDAEKLKHFRSLLLSQLRQNTEQVRTDQAAALELYDDGVKDSVDLSVQDLNKEIALRLGERSSKLVADIDQALLAYEGRKLRNLCALQSADRRTSPRSPAHRTLRRRLPGNDRERKRRRRSANTLKVQSSSFSLQALLPETAAKA